MLRNYESSDALTRASQPYRKGDLVYVLLNPAAQPDQEYLMNSMTTTDANGQCFKHENGAQKP